MSSSEEPVLLVWTICLGPSWRCQCQSCIHIMKLGPYVQKWPPHLLMFLSFVLGTLTGIWYKSGHVEWTEYQLDTFFPICHETVDGYFPVRWNEACLPRPLSKLMGVTQTFAHSDNVTPHLSLTVASVSVISLILFLGEIGEASGTAIHTVLHWNYQSMFRGEQSLMQRLQKEGRVKPFRLSDRLIVVFFQLVILPTTLCSLGWGHTINWKESLLQNLFMFTASWWLSMTRKPSWGQVGFIQSVISQQVMGR